MPEYKAPLHFKCPSDTETVYEIPLYTLSTDEEVTGKAAPVLMDKNLVYAAYGYSDNTFASAVKCKVPGVTYNSDNKVDIVGKNTNLLKRQPPTGTYTFSKTGTYTITFTVPTGINVLYCSPGTMESSSSDNYQYAYVSSGKYWFYLKQWSVFMSETWNDYSTDEPHYVAVTSGKTYTLSVYISRATTYPTISWSPEINKHTTDVSEL